MAKTRPFQGIFGGGQGASVVPLRREKHESQGVRRRDQLPVTFERRELNALLGFYGRMVKAGEWRDYALDHLGDAAFFSVFRRTQERPVYCFEKLPPRLRRQGTAAVSYAVYDAGGCVLRRSSSLGLLILYLEQRIAARAS